MQTQVLNALLQLIQAGGNYAIIGIVIWLAFAFLKVATITGFSYLGVKIVCETILGIYKISEETKKSTLSLLPQQLASRLADTLDAYHKSVNQILNDLDERLKGSKKSS